MGGKTQRVLPPILIIFNGRGYAEKKKIILRKNAENNSYICRMNNRFEKAVYIW